MKQRTLQNTRCHVGIIMDGNGRWARARRRPRPYAELWFTPVLWPDFGAAHLAAALADFRKRERRFGRALKEAV